MNGHKGNSLLTGGEETLHTQLPLSKSNEKPNNSSVKCSNKTNSARPISLIAPLNKNTVQVKVLTAKTQGLIDTGASISCVSKSFLKKTGLNLNNLALSNLTQVTGVSGEKVAVLGQIDVPIVIAGVCFSYPFHVLDSSYHSLIIGIDFLYDNQCSVDLGHGTLYVKDGAASARMNINSGCAKTTKPVCIHAREEIEIPVSVSRTFKRDIVLLEPVPTDKTIRVARCLVKPKHSKTSQNKSSAVIRVLNPTNEDVHLPINFTLASVNRVEVDKIITLDEHVASQECNVNVLSETSLTENSAETENVQFNISNSNLTPEQCTELQHFLSKNKDIFSNSLSTIGKTNVFTHRIDTFPGAKPVHMNHYRQGPIQKAETARQTKDMLERNIVSPSDSIWNSPVVLEKKKDNTWRFAIDYRNLNKITQAISHPIPRLEDVFDCIGDSSATIFSTLDLNSAYFQMELDPETKHKSAFVTHEGVYVFNRMPFGLKNAPMSFQMLMSQVLRGLHWKFVLCYIDDLLVWSKNFEEHLLHLGQVFAKLREANLTLKPDKCRFGLEKVMFLGHILSKDGVSVDSEKTEKVRNFPVPRSQTELKSFLGLCNYYRRFVEGFAHIATPLNQLLKGDKRGKFKTGDWTDECQTAFQKLKDALTSAPILGFPDMNKEFILSTDASGAAIGYILGQKDEHGKEYVIAYGGRALSKDERKWSVTVSGNN